MCVFDCMYVCVCVCVCVFVCVLSQGERERERERADCVKTQTVKAKTHTTRRVGVLLYQTLSGQQCLLQKFLRKTHRHCTILHVFTDLHTCVGC